MDNWTAFLGDNAWLKQLLDVKAVTVCKGKSKEAEQAFVKYRRVSYDGRITVPFIKRE